MEILLIMLGGGSFERGSRDERAEPEWGGTHCENFFMKIAGKMANL